VTADDGELIPEMAGMFRCPAGGDHDGCRLCGGRRWVDGAAMFRYRRAQRAAEERQRALWETELAQQPPAAVWAPLDTDEHFGWLQRELGFEVHRRDFGRLGLTREYRADGVCICVALHDYNRDPELRVELSFDGERCTLNDALRARGLPMVGLDLHRDFRRQPVGDRLHAASNAIRRLLTDMDDCGLPVDS
jgi:hypothetical protein